MRSSNVLIWLLLSALAIADPAVAENPWQPGPDMNTGRRNFPLVELASGKWLAAGGVTDANSGYGAEAETLAADATAWTAIAPMPSAHRGIHQGVVLQNGDVLIAGDDPRIPGGRWPDELVHRGTQQCRDLRPCQRHYIVHPLPHSLMYKPFVCCATI